MVKKWEVNKVNNEEVEQFAKKYKISNLLASILVRKGIKTDEEVDKFLHPTRMDFYNPFLLPDMEKAVKRINKAIENKDYGFILVNFANPDMVGHTGVLEAAEKACKVVDECVGKIAEKCKENNVTMVLTADHGNAEVMVDEKTGKPQTAHTTNEVPLVIINGPKDIQLKEDGALCNVAPTILQLMGIKKPDEMDCDSLIK